MYCLPYDQRLPSSPLFLLTLGLYNLILKHFDNLETTFLITFLSLSADTLGNYLCRPPSELQPIRFSTILFFGIKVKNIWLWATLVYFCTLYIPKIKKHMVEAFFFFFDKRREFIETGLAFYKTTLLMKLIEKAN